MDADLKILHYNETYVRIEALSPILIEIYNHFKFYTKNYRFHPKYKAGLWDGTISIFKMKDKLLLKGLLPDLIQWAEHNQYSYDLSERAQQGLSDYNIDDEKVNQLYEKLNGPFEPLDSQVDAVKHCINNGRAIILAPTSNGKSYIIHALAAFHAMQKQRVLVMIDRSQLIEQLRENLRDEYLGGEQFNYVTVYDKLGVPDDCDVYFTTWQSCVDNTQKWFDQFDVIIADEVHKFKADSLKKIFEKLGHVSIRYGFTATLDNDSQTDRLTIKGMFGTPHRVATIKELIEQGVVARPIVTAIILEYPDTVRREFARRKFETPQAKFAAEVKLSEEYEPRNAFIGKMDKHLDGNTLVAFKHHDHGQRLLNYLRDDAFFVNSTVKLKKRLDISKQIDEMKNSTAAVSIGTFSTGISIRNVNNIIITCQLMSKITVPQLIGRGMRKAEGKTVVHIFDIGDSLSLEGKNDNTLMKHFKERLQIYAESGFEIKIQRIKLS